MNEENSLLTGAVRPALLRYALPIILSMVATQFYAVADTMIIGLRLDADALAAVSNASTVLMIFLFISGGMELGGGLLVAAGKPTATKHEMTELLYNLLFVDEVIALIKSYQPDLVMNIALPYQDLHIHYTKGQHHLNGQQAMEVVRFRHNNDGSGYTDVGRAEMQRQVLVALAKKVVSWNSLTKVQEFVEIFQEYVKTDLSTTDMLYFASQAVGVDLDTGITQGTLEGRGEGVVRGYKYCFVFQAEDILPTLNELVNPYDQPLTEEDLDLPQAEYYWNGTVID